MEEKTIFRSILKFVTVLNVIAETFYLLLRRTILYISLCARYFAVRLVAGRLNYKSAAKPCVFTDYFNLSFLISIQNKWFYSSHNDNSCIQPYLIGTKIVIFSSFTMFLDSID